LKDGIFGIGGDMPDSQMAQIGQIAVRKGLITASQLIHVLEAQREYQAATGKTRQIGDMLIAKGFLTPEELHDLLKTQTKRSTRELAGFTLISRLGSGGMGTVYKARQKSLDREVALKVLPPKLAQDEIFIQRFFREARAVAKLNHPNIVQGIDVGEASGYFYFAMEFVEGATLKDIIHQRGAMPEKEALDIIEQMSKGLAHAHAHGLVHRDIKPDNVLIDLHGTAKLCDLGLARGTKGDSALTQTGITLGTPHYISPEQARSEATLDARADLYSLGATWFHLIAGTPPYTAGNPLAVITKHLSDPIPKVRQANPQAGISKGTELIICKLLAKKPDDRYASADDLLRDIQDLKSHCPPRIASKAVEPGPEIKKNIIPEKITPKPNPTQETDLLVKAEPAVVQTSSTGGSLPLIIIMALVILGLSAAVFFTINTDDTSKDAPPTEGPSHPKTGHKPKPKTGQPPKTYRPHKETPRLIRLRNRYDQALLLEKERPDDIDIHIAAWRRLYGAAGGTKYLEIANKKLRELAQKRIDLLKAASAQLQQDLSELDTLVDDKISKELFRSALESVHNFKQQGPANRELPRRLAALVKKIRNSAGEAVKKIVAQAHQQALDGNFTEARKALESIEKFRLPNFSSLLMTARRELSRLERESILKKARQARNNCLKAIADTRDMVTERKYSEALENLRKASNSVLKHVADEVLAPEIELLSQATLFLNLCRDKALTHAPDVKLTVQNVTGSITDFDPKTNAITVVLKLRGGQATGKGNLLTLEAKQLLLLTGLDMPKRCTPEMALMAGAFLALAEDMKIADEYLAIARKADLISRALEKALAIHKKGASEVMAEEKYHLFSAAVAKKNWISSISLAEELLKSYSDTKFLKPHIEEVETGLKNALRVTSPLVKHEIVFQTNLSIPSLGLASYSGASDAFLSDVKDPSRTSGDTAELMAFGFGKQAPLLQFDISTIPDEAQIISATLLLHCNEILYGQIGDKPRVELYAMTLPWSARSVCYANRVDSRGVKTLWPENNPAQARDTKVMWGHKKPGLVAFSNAQRKSWLRFDISRLVKAWHEKQRLNNGIYLHMNHNSAAIIASCEHPVPRIRPKLVISFQSKSLPQAADAPFEPRDCTSYSLDNPESITEFQKDFRLLSKRGTNNEISTPIQVGRGGLAVQTSAHPGLLLQARDMKFGAQGSVSFLLTWQTSRRPSGSMIFGFPIGKGNPLKLPGLFCQADVVTKSTSSSFKSGALNIRLDPTGKSRNILTGKLLRSSSPEFDMIHLRMSWRFQELVWFINGQRTGSGKLPPPLADRMSEKPLAISAGTFQQARGSEIISFKISRIAVGKPFDDDFIDSASRKKP
jgi:eukaryotic-like serine/threonine-protein kinase